MKSSLILCSILGITLCLGCESSTPPEVGAQSGEIGAPPPPQPTHANEGATDDAAGDAPAPDAAPAAEGAAPAAQPANAAPPAAEPPAAAPTAADGTSEQAAVGAGAKGRDYGDGFITTPVATMFRAEELIVFEAQIPKNLSLYKAEHDNKGPKTSEEFMQVIIKEGGVRLPELPPGDEYWYDPKTEELMVRHPKPAEQ